MRKTLLALTVIALSTVAYAKTYSITLFQPSLVNGVELTAGEYKLEVQDSKAVIRGGKQKVEADVKVENGDDKFNSTSVRYQNGDGKYRVQEIRLGGTKTKVLFN
jgi:hypothetical protein